MICYRDMSFCLESETCANEDCQRKLRDIDKERADEIGIPIAFMSFREACGKFQENKE